MVLLHLLVFGAILGFHLDLLYVFYWLWFQGWNTDIQDVWTRHQWDRSRGGRRSRRGASAQVKLNLWITVSYTAELFRYNNAVCLCMYRDIKDTTVGTLSQRITNQVHGLKGLNSKLLDIRSYLDRVAAGKLPINHQIIYQLQDVFNLLPDVNLLVCHWIWGAVVGLHK